MGCLLWVVCSMVGMIVTSSKRANATCWASQVCCSQSPSPWQATADPCHCRRHSDTQRQVWLSVCGGLWILVHTRFCLSPLSISSSYGILILNAISPSYHLVGVSPFLLDVGYLFLVGSNIFLLMVVQQQVAILEIAEEKMSAQPSKLPSW